MIKKQVSQSIELLSEDLDNIGKILIKIEEATQFDDEESAEEVRKAVEELKFYLPAITTGVMVLTEHAAQYSKEKNRKQ